MVVKDRPDLRWGSEVDQRRQERYTHHSRYELAHGCPDLPFFPNEHRVWSALHGTPSADAKVMDWARHVLETHEKCPPQHAKDHSAPKCPNKTFYSLLWRKFDQRSPTQCDPPNIGEYVVADDQGSRYPEPNQAFENVVDNEMTSAAINP